MFFCCLSLVEASQASVVTLVEPPALLNGQLQLVDLSEDSLESGLSSLEDAGVTNIKLVASLLQSLPRLDSLLHASLTETGVKPATEPVLLVPL